MNDQRHDEELPEIPAIVLGLGLTCMSIEQKHRPIVLEIM